VAYYSPRLIGGAAQDAPLPRSGLATFLAVLLALACLGAALGYALFGSDVIGDLKRAAVWIRVDGGERTGSGAIITPDGYVLTSAGVVKDGGAQSIEVILNSGSKDSNTLSAQITEHVGSSTDSSPQGAGKDYALLKIESEQALPCLPVVRSDNITEGNHCFIAGFPDMQTSIMGPNIKIDRGSIGRIDRGGDQGALTFHTDIASYSGMQGAPLTNDRGQIVGIITLHHVIADRSSGAAVQEVSALGVPTSRFSHVWEGLMR